jgi:hypothetical protein
MEWCNEEGCGKGFQKRKIWGEIFWIIKAVFLAAQSVRKEGNKFYIFKRDEDNYLLWSESP